MRRLILLLVSGALLLAITAMPALAQQTDYNRVVHATDSERFWASANWGVSDWNAERYGTFYRFAWPNTAFSDAAYYRFDIPETGFYDVYAWYPSDPGYNTATPIGVVTTTGIQWTTVDQTQQHGGVYLGTYEMEAGDNWNVLVSRWTSGQGYVIADTISVLDARRGHGPDPG